MKEYLIENCANSAESAARAQEGGAGRVELCAGIPEGGTTPSYGEIKAARKALTTTRLHVIIRPRGGDFCYTKQEQDIMVDDVIMARELGADGIAVGCLTPEGDVDVPAMGRIMLAARGISVTFHRAFDVCRNPFEAMETLIQLGCSRILSSGQAATAPEGVEMLHKLVEKAGGRIIIMPGCGINPGNIADVARATGAHEFHFSGRSRVESGMVYRKEGVSMGGTVTVEEYGRMVTDPEKIRAARAELDRLEAQ